MYQREIDLDFATQEPSHDYHQAAADAKGLTKTGDGLPARQDQHDHDHDKHFKTSVKNTSNNPATSINDHNPNTLQKNILEEFKRGMFGFIDDPQKLAMAMDALEYLSGYSGPTATAHNPTRKINHFSDIHNVSQAVNYLNELSNLYDQQLHTDFTRSWHNVYSHPWSSGWNFVKGTGASLWHGLAGIATFSAHSIESGVLSGIDGTFGTHTMRAFGMNAWEQRVRNNIIGTYGNIKTGLVNFNHADIHQQAGDLAGLSEAGIKAVGQGALIAGAFSLAGKAGELGQLGIFCRTERTVYHTVKDAKGGQGVLNGIDPSYFKPENRFGEAFYVSESPDTNLLELAHHDTVGVDTIRFNYNHKVAVTLDFTKPRIAKAWGYHGGNDYSVTHPIAEKAIRYGYNVIRFPSERGPGVNLAIFDDFDKLLSPQMVVPVSRDLYDEVTSPALR